MYGVAWQCKHFSKLRSAVQSGFVFQSDGRGDGERVSVRQERGLCPVLLWQHLVPPPQKELL